MSYFPLWMVLYFYDRYVTLGSYANSHLTKGGSLNIGSVGEQHIRFK